MRRRHFDFVARLALACVWAGCSASPLPPDGVDSGYAGDGKADAFIDASLDPDATGLDATGDASIVGDGGSCLVEPSRGTNGRAVALAADGEAGPGDGEAGPGDGARDPDIGDVDAPTCKGISDCSSCRCTPQLCISGGLGDPPTTCNPPSDGISDSCGCGCASCAAGLTCVRVSQPSATGGGGFRNRCFELCFSDEACGAGRVCRTNINGINVCVAPPSCLSDADCTADLCGHCVPQVELFHIGMRFIDRSKAECIYEGACATGSCTRCREDGIRSTPSGAFHLCTP
jgi:hypothetical protein